jgi:integrase
MATRTIKTKTDNKLGYVDRGITRIHLPVSGEFKLRVRVGGRDKRLTKLVDNDLVEAVRVRDLFERQLAGQVIETEGTGRLDARPEATVLDGFRQRILDLEAHKKEAGVPDRIVKFLARCAPEIGRGALADVDDETIRAYRESREEAHDAVNEAGQPIHVDACKPGTVGRELREWRAMMKRVRPDFRMDAALFPEEDNLRVRQLAPAEYHQVFPALEREWGPILRDLSELVCLGVMRLTEGATIKREYIDRTTRTAKLPKTKAVRRGPRTRLVNFSADAWAIVERALAREPQHEYLFANPRNGRPYSRVHISRCWRGVARMCGLQDFHFHDLRHHAPTTAINNGANEATLMAMGDWRSPAMVKRYAQVQPSTVMKYLDAAKPAAPAASPLRALRGGKSARTA